MIGQINPPIRTTCAYCGVGCGIQATVATTGEQTTVSVQGDTRHPANFGRLCSKGAALGETLSPEGRLLHPLVDGQRTSWESAIGEVARRFRRVIDQHGPDAVAFYVSGQLLTEDYYVANKLMKGFIGSGNIDTNSRLCMSSSVAGHVRAFGSDTVPGNYEDLELADLIILTGSNLAWCHPVLFQRIRQAKLDRPKLRVVVIDPRKTPSCDIADLHLPLAPGTDSWLFNGLLSHLARHGALDWAFLEKHTEGFSEAIRAAQDSAGNIPAVAAACGLAPADISTFFQWVMQTERTVTVYSQGVNQASNGTDKVNAIINTHLATGRIGRPGMGPFSVTGQPNAMGGREVGGLANTLAAHMDFNHEHVDRVQRFWHAPRIASKPGLKAVDLFQAIEAGTIKAVWIMATNPVVSLPEADRVKAALSKAEVVVVSDCVRHTDTTRYAHIQLPAQGWSEKDGTVTNSERRISRQRQVVDAIGEAKSDWWIAAQVGKALGFYDAFNFASPADVFREHAALSAFENNSAETLRDFNLGPLASISDSDYDALEPVQWPIAADGTGTPRLFAEGGFYTPNRKARLIAITPRGPAQAVSDAYPLALNTGRIRDQWHTMTRTGLAPKLSGHYPEPFVEIHPTDAQQLRVTAQELAVVSTATGQMIARVNVTPEQRPGSLFVPMHWTGELSTAGRVGPLVNAIVDPLSGQPESKHTPATLTAYAPAWQGFLLSRRDVKHLQATYQVLVRGEGFFRREIAGDSALSDWSTTARELLCDHRRDAAEWIEYRDVRRGIYRAARLVNGEIESCLMVTAKGQLPSREWLASLFREAVITDDERRCLLSGKPPVGQADAGRIVCACLAVGEQTIRHCAASMTSPTAEKIGQQCGAGTNCGSCIPEIRRLIGA